MCGRFQLSVKGKVITQRYQLGVYDEIFKPSFNCAPAQLLPIIIWQGTNRLQYFKWGLIPSWASNLSIGNRLINARAETIEEKSSFREAFKSRRCLIPANGFYEWKKDSAKTPYRFFMKDESVFSMAGIWESWRNNLGETVHTFSILTTRPNTLVGKVHQRMPVILNPLDEQAWLQESQTEKLNKLLVPFDASKMEAYPVSKRVNSPSNNDIRLIEPAGRQTTLFK
jgi:putative SOS response-associated peptidase YedK